MAGGPQRDGSNNSTCVCVDVVCGMHEYRYSVGGHLPPVAANEGNDVPKAQVWTRGPRLQEPALATPNGFHRTKPRYAVFCQR